MTVVDSAAVSPYDLKRWHVFKSAKEPQYSFGYFLAPIMEHIYQLCVKKISDSKYLQCIISNEFLLQILTKQFQTVFVPMVLKCALWEMHVARNNGHLKAASSKQRFDEFIEIMSDADFINYFFAKYPPLKQAIDYKVAAIVENWCEFFQRLDEDWLLIKKVFLGNSEGLSLVDLSVSGDTHCMGRHVMCLEFECEKGIKQSVIYKPRDLKIDLAFNGLIDWFNGCGGIQLKAFHIENRDSYGWCEFITHEPCNSLDEIKRFYQRQGALLAIIYCLNGSDIHSENLIAHGEYPVIVDLECLITPKIESELGQGFFSVLDSLLLPKRVNTEGGIEDWKIGGIGGDGGGKVRDLALSYEKPGTDEMSIVRVDFEINKKNHNIPLYKNKMFQDNQLSYEHVMLGFSEGYYLFKKHTDLLYSVNSPLRQFLNAESRILFRPTSMYEVLLVESFHPDVMCSEENWEKHFAVLTSSSFNSNLFEAERDDFISGDIPFFGYKIGSNKLYSSEGVLDLNIEVSGYDALVARIRLLGEADFNIQAYIIRTAYTAEQLNVSSEGRQSVGQYASLGSLKFKNFSSDSAFMSKLTMHVDNILNHIDRLAILNASNITWPCLSQQSLAKATVSFDLNLHDQSFLNGGLGVVLSLACAAKNNNHKKYSKTVDSYLSALLKLYQGIISVRGGLSFSDRTFGLYALDLISQCGFSVNPAINELLLLDMDRVISEDSELDILGGCAGLMCVTQNKKLLQKLVMHLFKCYPDPKKNPDMTQFETVGGASMIGFGHGVSGINVALARANQHLKDPKVDAWIQRSLDYLDEVYDAHGYWPNMCDQSLARGSLWCHGAVGVAEGYLNLLDVYPTKQVERGLSRAIKEVKMACEAFVPGSRGYYCCGYLGAHNFILNAHQRRPDLVAYDVLDHENKRLIDHIEKSGYDDFIVGQGDATLGFLYGASGLAYHLLRLLKPDVFPSVMTL